MRLVRDPLEIYFKKLSTKHVFHSSSTSLQEQSDTGFGVKDRPELFLSATSPGRLCFEHAPGGVFTSQCDTGGDAGRVSPAETVATTPNAPV